MNMNRIVRTGGGGHTESQSWNCLWDIKNITLMMISSLKQLDKKTPLSQSLTECRVWTRVCHVEGFTSDRRLPHLSQQERCQYF